MMKIFFWQVMLLLLITNSGCSDDGLPPNISSVLEKAGDNKRELLKVIHYFSRNNKDSLKLKAAYFLIYNMDGMQTLDTESVENNKKYFNFIAKIDRSKLVFPVLTWGVDSMIQLEKINPIESQARYVDELKTVSADFLIKNIDSAFWVWENMPWSKSVNFNDFCEYILPYRSTATYSTDIRSFFLKRFGSLPDSMRKSGNMLKVGKYIIEDLKPWFKEDPNIILKYPFLVPISFSDLINARVGACNDANSVRVAALRAMGIRAAFDEIPNWGNCNMPHFWYKIIDPANDTIHGKIDNLNVDRNTQHIISATSYDELFYPGTPPDVQIAYNRTVPKVYRRCFSIQTESLASVANGKEVPPYFQEKRLKDVTSEYVETATARVALNYDKADNKFVYLSVFDNQQWVPVAWAPIKNKEAVFKDLGKNIVYLPCFYQMGQLVPASDPFLLAPNGDTKVIRPDSQIETVRLKTKFPVRTYVLHWESYMLGTRFQLSNRPDFSDSVTIHTVNKLPFYDTEVKLKLNRKFRYLIYQFSGKNYIEVSELEFYRTGRNGKEVKITGTPIGNPGYYPYVLSKLFDSIPYNFYRADTSLNLKYVGLDMGKGKLTEVKKIKYIPYSDDNAVRKGNTYTLYYWNNKWISIGENTALDKYVYFDNVPKNALLLLINNSGGIQQRIFTFKSDKQHFW